MRILEKALTAVAALTTVSMPVSGARAVEATRAPAGTLADGTAVEAITLKANNGVSAVILS